MLYLVSQILDITKRKYADVYADAEREIADILRMHLKGRPTGFAGTQWDAVVRRIARILYTADLEAVKIINDQLAEAYAEGSNVTLYEVERELGHKIGVLPYTSAVVSALVEVGVTSLNTKSLNRNKDEKWGKTKLYGAIRVAAGMNNLEYNNLPTFVARRVVNGIEKSMDDAARVVVSGSYDNGIYAMGMEVHDAGVSVEKTWLAIMDMNVRDSHKHLNNTTIPVDSVFQSFHGPIRFPHDPSAALEEICGCRCRMAVHIKGRTVKYGKDRILPTETLAYRKWRDNRIAELGGEIELIRKHLEIGE